MTGNTLKTWVNALTTLNSPVALAAVNEREQRHTRAMSLLSGEGRSTWPPPYADPFPGNSEQVPEIHASAMSTDVVGGAVAHHGSVIVRELLSARQVGALRRMQDIVKSKSLRDRQDRSGWYVPYAPEAGREAKLRERVQKLGGNWLVDSPRGLNLVLQTLEAVGIIGLMSEHFGEQPAISLQKCTLRSVDPNNVKGAWHQDGSFLGPEVRTMNIWIALSRCGGGTAAAGMEVVPTRIKDILAGDPAGGRASVAGDVREEVLGRHPPVVPSFEPGDALLFDEKMLHRTAQGTHFSEVRYALECWFFAPSHASPSYTPFLA